MLGWLAKKNENARVYMCVKEVKWDLESADLPRRAALLLIAQWFRAGMTDTNKGAIPTSYFDRPLDHSRSDLVELYTGLENIRNNNARQRQQIEKAAVSYGGMPSYAVEQSKNTNRGIEILMCTVGAGIAPDTREDVRQIWKMLSEALPYAPEAMRRLKEIAKLTEERTGSNASGMFDELPVDEWLAAASFVPSAFR